MRFPACSAALCTIGSIALAACGGKVVLDGQSAGAGGAPATTSTSDTSTITVTTTTTTTATTTSTTTTTTVTTTATTTTTTSTGTGGGPVAIASLDRPYWLALDDAYVYATYLGATEYSGGVVKIPKAGGAPIVLASGGFTADFMAIDDTMVYFDSSTSTDSEFRAVPKAGGPVTVIDAGECSGIAVDAKRVYCGPYNGAQITAYDKPTFAKTIVGLGTGGTRGLAVDDTRVYWGSEAQPAVFSMPKTGGGLTLLTNASPWNIAIDADRIYWGNNANSGTGVWAMPKQGGTPTLVASSAPLGTLTITIDDTSVYWVTGGAVHRTPKSGGADTVLATGQGDVRSIVVDASGVYWANLDYGTVMHLVP
jgi:hypothetical protein